MRAFMPESPRGGLEDHIIGDRCKFGPFTFGGGRNFPLESLDVGLAGRQSQRQYMKGKSRDRIGGSTTHMDGEPWSQASSCFLSPVRGRWQSPNVQRTPYHEVVSHVTVGESCCSVVKLMICGRQEKVWGIAVVVRSSNIKKGKGPGRKRGLLCHSQT